MYVPPHVHTDYSNYGMQDSVNRIDGIVAQLKKLGQMAWCCTDHNTCSGIVDAYKKSKKAGIKLIPGAELYLTHDLTIQQRDLYHITFWAKNNKGLENLYKLTTEAHGNKGESPNNFYYKCRVDIDLIRKYSEGLMVGSACLGGFVNCDNGEYYLQQLIEIFPNDIFLELHTYQCEEQFVYNRRLIELSKKYSIPLIAATDAHFTVKEDVDLRNYFKNTSKEQDESETTDGTLYLQSEEEIMEYLKYLPSDIVKQAIANTQILSDKSNVEIKFGEKHYPEYPCDNPFNELRRQCQEGWKKIIKGSGVDEKAYAKQVWYEYDVFQKQDYCSYFLITADYLGHAVCEDIPIGPGRGSVVASMVSQLMGITKLDPIKYNLVFERFAHNERIAPPDIDCDISRKHRHKVIEYIRQKYGEVYQCRTFQVLGAKGALRRAAMALKYTQEETNNIINHIDKYDPGDDEEEISSYEQKIWMLDHIRNEDNAKVVDLAKRFVGIISGYGKHASAVIILNEDITKFCSIERQTDSKTKEPCYIAACSFPLLEEQGLMKADVLGLKTLDVIYDTIKMSGSSLDINKIPLDDEKTCDMLCAGGTSGCFQIESPGMTQLVKAIQPKHFTDLIPLVALYRPGPKNAIVEETGDTMLQTYVKVRNGEIEPTYLHPKLKPILQDTYSIILYQESILEIVKELCGYSLGEADVLRRIIGKKKVDEMKPALDKMVERGVANGIPEDTMRQISDRIVTFALYGFNKSHSAAYGLIAYQTAYLKAHFPLEFMCATINSEENNQENILPYINESKRLGFQIIPPDIRKGNIEWVIEDNGLRIGLYYIKGIGKKLKLNEMSTFEAFIANNAKDTNTALIKAGALDFYGISRKDMLKVAYKIPEERTKIMSNITKNNQKIEDLQKELSETKETLKKYQTIKEQIENRIKDNKKQEKKLVELSALEKELNTFDEVAGEFEVLGFSFKQAPKVLAGEIKKIYTIIDCNGKEMAFLTLSSDYGEKKATVFQDYWKRIKLICKVGNKYKFVVSNKGILEDIKCVE